MFTPRKLGALAALTTATAALATAGAAAAPRNALDLRDRGAVFVQTDNPAGNAIAV